MHPVVFAPGAVSETCKPQIKYNQGPVSRAVVEPLESGDVLRLNAEMSSSEHKSEVVVHTLHCFALLRLGLNFGFRAWRVEFPCPKVSGENRVCTEFLFCRKILSQSRKPARFSHSARRAFHWNTGNNFPRGEPLRSSTAPTASRWRVPSDIRKFGPDSNYASGPR